MSRFAFTVDDDGGHLAIADGRRGLLDRFRRRERIDFDALTASDRALAIALARIRALDRDSEHYRFETDSLFFDHWMLSRIDDMSGSVLDLPKRTSGIEFHAEMQGTVGSSRFSLDWWWEKEGRQVQLKRVGAIVQIGSERMRLPAPIFDAIALSAAFDSGAPLTSHWAALAEFRKSIGMADEKIARAEGFLERIEIVSCDRVGLDVGAAGTLDFAPMPFSSAELGENQTASTETAALRGEALERFQQEATNRGAKPAYQVGENRYLILDRSAMPVVDVIARYTAASDDEKKDFLENAGRIVSDAIEEALRRDGALNELALPEEQAEAVENAFQSAWAETQEWAERVIEIRKWTKVEIIGLEGSGTSWLPTDIDSALGELLGSIPDEDLADLVKALENALAEGETLLRTDHGEIPVEPIILEALRRRLELYLSRDRRADAGEGEVTAFLPVTRDNFWELEFQEKRRLRPDDLPRDLPETVRRQLRFYQEEGFAWQVEAWQAGLPGILNADEQGLGKTLQTLSFLAWLSSVGMKGSDAPPYPFLIVAPTSLLRNWEAEIEAHLEPGIWGTPVRLYGPDLSQWKVDGARGRDTQDGRARLDLTDLYRGEAPRLAITTYQTLANYAVSFYENRFSVVVFDEIQNIKNPVTLRAVAAKAVNADFRIGLTGTPVENATRDIWAVMDQLFPGALGSLSDFRIAFDKPKAGNMQALHKAIFQPQAGFPSLGLRRRKDRVANDLPTKTRILYPRIMPAVQALRYDEARKPGQSLFGLLHHIRRTSLHPGLIEGEEIADFTQSSARIDAAMDILARIKARKERALVFVENRDVQLWFSELIKIEFSLPRVDIINGSTPIAHRQEITRRFQRHLKLDEGFDVLLMGPRAAGTGLTLTAANHVIHLTRWWNPAVEEQCNDRTHRIGQSRPVTIHIPLAIHPRLQRGSFDCLLQALMRRKRSLADSVLWPPESDESEIHALYDAVVTAEEVGEDGADFRGFDLADHPELVAEEIDRETIRVKPKAGGASVVVSTEPSRMAMVPLVDDDAAAYLLAGRGGVGMPASLPVSVLGSSTLWPDYVLPE
ncbi:DEAD/DEAH box helicase [Hwanghaeella grinnelliae]|uniref:DEAD/DEAH box helicase n=1 Tax=Hwanghaeella grinnelliae TaxID=2500179 RepID=A0A3S2WPC8_9PROT|nr:DEAD/DEAH box helicase [Hwanghaeella grinnelliae]RVU33944.1 DEAD/DEAH box helicase [Hwanghaeella grinnelliae]